MDKILLSIVALFALPFEATAFDSSSTSVSSEWLRNFQRGSSVATLASSRGGDIGEVLGTSSKVSSPHKLKDYLATTNCSAGSPSDSGDLSLSAARLTESRRAGVARCDALCTRIVSLPRDDSKLDLLTSAWIIEALQVTASPTAFEQSPGLINEHASTMTIESVGGRFFDLPDTLLVDAVEAKPLPPDCSKWSYRSNVFGTRTITAHNEYKRGLQFWGRVAESFPTNSALSGFALDWIFAYLAASGKGCIYRESLVHTFRWPADYWRSRVIERPSRTSTLNERPGSSVPSDMPSDNTRETNRSDIPSD